MNQFEVKFSHIVRGQEVTETNWISTPEWETELTNDAAIETLEEDGYNVSEVHDITEI